MRSLVVCCLFTVFCILSASYVHATEENRGKEIAELMSLSLDDLMNLEVSLASRTGKKLSDVPAAIYVITQEDIRRSGALNIPDLLRMVSGFQVAQIDSTLWAISARGFNDRFSNKLLIQIDGRSVYTTIFSGVHWDRHDLMLEDIDRIEVILGAKLEYNDYTAFEPQPNARLVWTPNSKNTIWAAVSRAEHSIRLNYGSTGGTPIIIFGTPNFDSETVIAYEIGYRVQPSKRISFDIAAFCNVYDNLLTLEQGSLIFENGSPVVPIYPNNKMHGETYGVEMAAERDKR